MRIRLPKGQRKEQCSRCGGPLEADRIGKQSHCRDCRIEYMKEYRQAMKDLIAKGKEYYKQYSGQV